MQNAIAQQEKAIAITTELKKALMHKLFTEGTRNEPQKQTEIGLIPESWDLVRLKESINIKKGQVDPKKEPYKTMLHVGSEHIKSNTGRFTNLKTNQELRISSGNYHFTEEDILYSKIRPYLNKVAVPDFEGTCSADMYPIRPKENYFSRDFLFQFFLSNHFNIQAISFQDRTGIPKINRAQLGSIFAIKPSLVEQNEIGEYLKHYDNKLDIIHKKKNILQDLFQTLLHQLMTAKIRVSELNLDSLNLNLEE